MPVRFKGSSEYKENFKPFVMQPVAAPSTQHAPGHESPWTGADVGKSVEPPIQHKKRIDGPPTSMACDFYERTPPQEYTLLGQNDKFAPNVCYMPTKKLNLDNVNRSQNNTTFIQPEPNQPIRNLDSYNIEKLNLEMEGKVAYVKKAPKVDTRKYVDPPTPAAPREPINIAETKHTQTTFRAAVSEQAKAHSKGTKTAVQDNSRVTHSQGQSKAVQPNDNQGFSKVGSSPPAKRHSPSKKHNNVKVSVDKQAQREEVYKAALKDKNLSDVLDRQTRKQRVNERTQTNVEKGILDSAPEAVSDYALRYKANRGGTMKGRKWSEYQREYEWKNRVPDSPLLAADQVVHKSSTTLVAPKSAPKPRASEYKTQFKAWKMKPVERKDKVDERKDKMDEPETKKAKLKRSKSMGALSENVAANERENRGRQHVRKSLKDKSEIAALVSSSHGKLRRTESEYDSNFRAPSQFQYRDGAWQGAIHPQAYFSKDKTVEQNKASEQPVSNWYLEVLELRQKADEYRKRAQGTHFSRAHLAQLLARQAEMWDSDTQSTSRCSTISALSLETGDAQQAKKHNLKAKTFKKKSLFGTQKESINDMDSTKATVATDFDSPSSIDFEERRMYNMYKGAGDNVRPSRRTAWTNYQSEDTLTDDGWSAREEVETPVNGNKNDRNNNYDEGRLPTPQLQQMKNPQRHHFDRTTPCVGGAILSSPPQSKKRPMKRYVTKENTRMQVYQDDLSDDDDEEETRLIGRTYNLSKMTPKATYGQPSYDTHYLLDEDASTDRPLKTQFIQTPVPSQSEESDADSRYVNVPRKKHSPAPVMAAINENFGQTYTRPPVPPLYYQEEDVEYYEDDEDALSVSVRSVTSSCSLASEILERTRHRTNNFWKPNGVATR